VTGVDVDCPVPDTTGVWILSPRRVVEAFVHAHDLPSEKWPTTRVVNLPGITLTVREMIDAMGRVVGEAATKRVRFVPDARIQGIVKTWPVRFRTERAVAMGFKADESSTTSCATSPLRNSGVDRFPECPGFRVM
jgi:nucleoside-diphosphate-sugar epimerase